MHKAKLGIVHVEMFNFRIEQGVMIITSMMSKM